MPNQHSLYNPLEFELHAYRGDGPLPTFTESLRSLQERGYQRHARPAEAFGLLFDSIEGKLQDEAYLSVARDMLSLQCRDLQHAPSPPSTHSRRLPMIGQQRPHREWLSCVIQVEGNKLHAYLDPKNLAHYDIPDAYGELYLPLADFSFAEKLEFSLRNLPPPKIRGYAIADVAKMHPELVTFLYGRPFAEIPERIQNNAQVQLSTDPTQWAPYVGPLVRYNFDVLSSSSNGAASRGVIEKRS